MEEKHTPIIIKLILSTDLAVIQLKDSYLILHISQQGVRGVMGDLTVTIISLISSIKHVDQVQYLRRWSR